MEVCPGVGGGSEELPDFARTNQLRSLLPRMFSKVLRLGVLGALTLIKHTGGPRAGTFIYLQCQEGHAVREYGTLWCGVGSWMHGFSVQEMGGPCVCRVLGACLVSDPREWRLWYGETRDCLTLFRQALPLW